MTDIIIKNPLIAYTGEKLKIMQINFENVDESTQSENQESREKPLNQQNISPTEEEGAETERHVNLNKFKKDGKNNSVKNIGRKTRRKNVEKGKWGKNINKIKNEKK